VKDRTLRKHVGDLKRLVSEQRKLIDHLDKINQMHVEAEELSRQERIEADQMLCARRQLQELAEEERKEADRVIRAQQQLHTFTESERLAEAQLNTVLLNVQELADQERIESEDQLKVHWKLSELNSEEIKQRDGILEEILKIGRHINRLLPEEELLRLILVSSMEHLGADIGAVVMQDGGKPELRIALGFSEDFRITDILAKVESARIELQGGPDVHASKQMVSIVSTLTRESRPVGALFLGKKEGECCFRNRDLEFLDLFAIQVSLALNNAHLFDSVRVRNRELKRALMLKNNFIEHLSDDLRKPLTKLHNQLSGDEELDRKEAVRLSEWLMRALDKVLSVAALKQESEEMFSHDVSIVSLSNQIFQNMDDEIRRLGLTTEVTTRGVVPLFEGNRDVFNTILDEVICNAVVYNRPGGSVRVLVSLENHRLTIVVRDSGIGISRADQAKVFNRFFRSEASYEHYSRGAGLGLYIVRSFVENYGGIIRIESEKGVGSEVIIELPV